MSQATVKYEHPLRDLARKIEATTREHETYAMAGRIVQPCVDYLNAVAGYHEAWKKITDLEDQINGMRLLGT